MSEPLTNVASVATILSGATVMGSIGTLIYRRAELAAYFVRVAAARGEPRQHDLEAAIDRTDQAGGQGTAVTVANKAAKAFKKAGLNKERENMIKLENFARNRSQSRSPSPRDNGEGPSRSSTGQQRAASGSKSKNQKHDTSRHGRSNR